MRTKTVREMSMYQKMSHSLSARTFRWIVLLALLVSVSAIAFGFYLYSSMTSMSYRERTWHVSSSAVAVSDRNKTEQLADKVLATYEKAIKPEIDQKTGHKDKADYNKKYSAIFRKYMDDSYYKTIRPVLTSISDTNNMSSIYIAALDTKRNKQIYIIDSDKTGNFCPPGYWESIGPDEINIYLKGDKPELFEKYIGSEKTIPAYVSRSQRYGYICSAATEMYKKGDYIVMAFADCDMNKVAEASRHFMKQYILLMLGIAVLLSIIVVLYFRRTIVHPVNSLAKAAFSYANDKNLDSGGKTKTHFDKLSIKTGDEIENLSLAMQDMENDVNEYMNDLMAVTAEREKFNTELNVAKTIQEGILPNNFPAFPDHPEIDIYAQMTAAKEVGGDFYDFFRLDDDRIALIIADVAGKGVPAALFMMASRIMLENIVMNDKESPAHILEMANESICDNNSNDMFITIWIGILDLRTGLLRASNAGHEYPAIRRSNGEFELYNDKHGFVIGGLSGMKYSEYEIQLNKGDCIFQYTDGITEARRSDGEMFGNERLIQSLNQETEHGSDEDPAKIIHKVKRNIDEFMDGAEQSDDITMLCCKYMGNDESSDS